jgi:hypothetical protein
MYQLFKTPEVVSPLSTNSDDISLQQIQEIHSAFDLDAPGAITLARVCSRDNLFFSLRTLGAGLLSAGLTSIGCDYMMNDSPDFKLSQGLLVGVGSAIYIAGSADVSRFCSSYEDSWPHFQQCARDAIVPAVTAMSVYLAKAHQII